MIVQDEAYLAQARSTEVDAGAKFTTKESLKISEIT